MSWYVLRCKSGQEDKMIRFCQNSISKDTLEDVFIFQSERLWKTEGVWKTVRRDMFPGYVFLQSSRPETLLKEIKAHRFVLDVIRDQDYLISVYEDEEAYLRKLCSDTHFLKISYGYKDRLSGISHVTDGPLAGFVENIVVIDWHKRFAKLKVYLDRRQTVIFAGMDISAEVLKQSACK